MSDQEMVEDTGFEGDLEDVWVEPPRCYLFHYFDDEVFGFMGPSLIHLVRALSPCRVAMLGLDEEAFMCETLDELASAMVHRIEADVQENPCSSWPSFDDDQVSASAPRKAASTQVERIVLVGYGLGASVAHCVARKLEQEHAGEVGLVLLDSDISWPPAYSVERMGGYQWLGGKLEAALLMCRACGLQALATALVQELLGKLATLPGEAEAEAEADGAGGDLQDDVLMRIFWALAPGGMSHEYFHQCLAYLSSGLDLLNQLCATASGSPQVFDGHTLMISSSSREFWSARESNRKFCSDFQVAQSRGSHYCMVQEEHVLSCMKPLCDFLVSRGFFGPEPCKRAETLGRNAGNSPAPEAPATSLSVLSEGDDPDAPTVYIVHDLRPYVTDEWKERVAELLAPCRIVMPVFDEAAAACRSREELAADYEARINSDIQQRLPPAALEPGT